MADEPRRPRVVVFNASEDTVDLLTTFFGVLAGEWKDTERHIIGTLAAGILVLMTAILVLSLANRL